MEIVIKDLLSKEVNRGEIFPLIKENEIEFIYNNEKYIFNIINNNCINLKKIGDMTYFIEYKKNESTSNIIKYNDLEFKINIYTEDMKIEKEKISLRYIIFEEFLDDILSSYEITLSLT